MYCYTLWAHLFGLRFVLRSCMLLRRPIAEPLVRPRPTRAYSLHIVSGCTLSVSVTHTVQQDTVWPGLIG